MRAACDASCCNLLNIIHLQITIMSWQGEIGVKIAEGNVSGNVSSLTWLSSERLLIGIANNRELQMWQSMSDGGEDSLSN